MERVLPIGSTRQTKSVLLCSPCSPFFWFYKVDKSFLMLFVQYRQSPFFWFFKVDRVPSYGSTRWTSLSWCCFYSINKVPSFGSSRWKESLLLVLQCELSPSFWFLWYVSWDNATFEFKTVFWKSCIENQRKWTLSNSFLYDKQVFQ